MPPPMPRRRTTAELYPAPTPAPPPTPVAWMMPPAMLIFTIGSPDEPEPGPMPAPPEPPVAVMTAFWIT